VSWGTAGERQNRKPPVRLKADTTAGAASVRLKADTTAGAASGPPEGGHYDSRGDARAGRPGTHGALRTWSAFTS
jgi:hypothetical protein